MTKAFPTVSRAAWRQRRSMENKQRHAEQMHRSPGWNDSLPPGSVSIRAAAQQLSMKQGELFAWLSENGWIARDEADTLWRGCGEAIERRWLAIRRKTIGFQRYVVQVMPLYTSLI